MTLSSFDPESTTDQTDRIVAITLADVEVSVGHIGTLNTVIQADTDRIAQDTEHRDDMLGERKNEEAFLATVFPRARFRAWTDMDRSGGYVADEGVLANAARLSPPDDTPESDTDRNDRVRNLGSLASLIVAGRPTVIGWRNSTRADFCAGIPEHDGFSLRLDGDDPNRNEFLVGLNATTPIRLGRIIFTGDQPYNIAVHSQEDGVDYLRDQIKRHVAQSSYQEGALERALDQEHREAGVLRDIHTNQTLIMKGMVSAVNAAREVGATGLVESDRLTHVLEMLSTHMFKTGDEQMADRSEILAIAEAIKYIYPTDAEQPLTEYFITRSVEHGKKQFWRHNWGHVVTVLHEVCELPHSEQHEAVQRLSVSLRH